jgi:hypothetical protein
MAFERKDLIANDQVLTVAGATPFHFGVLSSSMHMAWVRHTCGRLKSDYRYSKDIVYNNFPWPMNMTASATEAVEEAARQLLSARANHAGSSLADLYDPLTMPPDLTKAHQALDRTVDAAYGKKSLASDADRVAFLFELYRKYTSMLPAEPKKAKKPRRSKVN